MKTDVDALSHLSRAFGLSQWDLEPLARSVATTATGLSAEEAATCATWRISTGLFAAAKQRVTLTAAERDMALRTHMSPDAMLQAKIVKLARQVDAIERSRVR